MRKSQIFLLGALITVSSSAWAQQTQKFTANKHNEYGLVYSLPATHFNIEVEATKTIKKAGPYYKYAKQYLGTTDVVTEDSQNWDLKSIDITSYGVPDKSEEYLMQFKNGSAPFLVMTENGLPLSINIDQEAPKKQSKTPKELTTSVLENNGVNKALTGELLMSESVAKKAQIAANQIYAIRDSRNSLISGDADQMPPDGASLKITMDQLDSQEAALMALFLGTTQTATFVKDFDFTPTGETNKEVVLRISDFNGMVDKNDLSGEPVYLSLKVTAKGELPVNEKGEVKKLPKGAVMYKIPGKAQVTLNYNGKDVLSKNLDVAQFGIDFGLDPEMFTDKKQPAYIIYYPQTGALKELGTVASQPK